MSPAGNVAAASGLGAAVGGFAGFLLAFAGSKITGASPKHASVAALLGMAAGAVVGAASVGAYEEKRVIGSGSPLADAIVGAGLKFTDATVPTPLKPGCYTILHCDIINGKQVCVSSDPICP